ncbi:MAG: NlpC/P60 family protein [Gaiellaceae bacterium MAG52_C11]|nr:NlpC/P60 family protein [Candidatus Gaiellasilicea maunaloa]
MPAFLVLLAAVLAAVVGGSVKSASADPSVTAKRAEAQDVLAQIRAIDGQLGHAVEAYNLATVRLDGIEAELKTNARHLAIARSSLAGAQQHLSERLVALYVNGRESSAVEVLLGAESLDDLLNRLDAVERVSEQDARVLREVKSSKLEVRSRKQRLEAARKAQTKIVDERASRRSSIEGQLRERQRMLSSIKGQIAELEAAEARRQARLEAQARARLAAASRQQAQARAAAPSVAAAPAPGVAAPTATAATAAPFTTADPAVAPLDAPAARFGGAVGIAMQYLGVPYRWGGGDPSGFDCSGFSMYVYGKLGVSLPHHAASQYGMGSAVSRDRLEGGDLVFFNGLGHMGIYIGGGQFIHAPHSGDVVKISNLSDSWYASTWVGARRI